MSINEPVLRNPHPPFPAPEAPDRPSICDLGCLERYTPKRFRQNALFKKIDFLGCYFEDKWTDAEIRLFLVELEQFFRKDLTGRVQILNWFSLSSWLEQTEATWEIASGGDFGIDNEDFYSRYDLSTKDIWLTMSDAVGHDFNEDGFDYWEWTLKPYIGTNLIQRKILEKLEIDGEIVDWYDNKGINNSYSFVMENFPGWEKARILIINSRLLKNAESILISLRDSRCPTRFLLSDGGHLDKDFLSDITALKFEGVHICFQRYHKFLFDFFNDFDTFVRMLVSSERGYLVDFFSMVQLSENLELDGLSDRTVFLTKTNFWPTRQIQLLPAYISDGSSWGSGITWEDHYTWGNVDITNLVRTILPHESLFTGMGWPSSANWERWTDWYGEQADSWFYNKPGISGIDYFENPNYIPGYEPNSGKSLYRLKIGSVHKRDHIEDVFNNRSQKINFWDEWELSYDEYISPSDGQIPERRKIVYFAHNKDPKDYSIMYSGFSITEEHISEENIHYTEKIVGFYDQWKLSENVFISPSGEQFPKREKEVYEKKERLEGDTTFHNRVIYYWDVSKLSEDEFISPLQNQLPQKGVVTMEAHFSSPEGFLVDYTNGLNFIIEKTREESMNETKELITFFNSWRLSDEKYISPDVERPKESERVVYSEKTSEEKLPNQEIINYDYNWRLSREVHISPDEDMKNTFNVVYSKHTSS